LLVQENFLIYISVVMAATQREYEFVLLHGGCYGAWAWFPVEAELRKAGYKVTAMDMAGAGVHPADPDAIATFDEYHQPALEFLESLPAKEKVQKPPLHWNTI